METENRERDRLPAVDDDATERVKHPVLVILPAYNESGRIGRVVHAIRACLPCAEVVVIDDASMDSTSEEALAAGALVLPHPVNLGYGAALETGYRYAREKTYAAILQMDADGQHLPEELPVLLEPILAGRADLVIGSRYLPSSGTYPTAALTRAGQRFFSFLLRVFGGPVVQDPTSGFQALGPRAARFLSSGVLPCDYPDADVLLMAHYCGLRIQEVPVRMLPRAGGISMHNGLKPCYYILKMILSLIMVLLNFSQWRRWREVSLGISMDGYMENG